MTQLQKFQNQSKLARDNSFLEHVARIDLSTLVTFLNGVFKTMSYGHNRPVSPERVINLVSRLIDEINDDILDYDSTTPDEPDDTEKEDNGCDLADC